MCTSPLLAYCVAGRVIAPLARLGDGLDAARIVERGEVAGVLAQVSRADHAAHDLGAAGLGQFRGEEDALRLERLAHLLGDEIRELGAERFAWLRIRAQHREA